jgi:hypothetical protein
LESDIEKKRSIRGDLIKDREELRVLSIKVYNIGAKMLEAVTEKWFYADRLAKTEDYHRDYKK